MIVSYPKGVPPFFFPSLAAKGKKEGKKVRR
jgi:hypothetical protein